MAQAIRRPKDGSVSTERPQSHPRDQLLAGITVVVRRARPDHRGDPGHALQRGCAAALAALGVGAVSQLISETTNERWFNVTGVIAGAVGLAFAISNGGFDLLTVSVHRRPMYAVGHRGPWSWSPRLRCSAACVVHSS